MTKGEKILLFIVTFVFALMSAVLIHFAFIFVYGLCWYWIANNYTEWVVCFSVLCILIFTIVFYILINKDINEN